MLDVMERASREKFPGVRLVQVAYHHRSLSLYTKLGFETRETLSAMYGPALNSAIPGHAVRAATGNDVEACDILCRSIHGHDRHGELLDAIAQGKADHPASRGVLNAKSASARRPFGLRSQLHQVRSQGGRRGRPRADLS